MTNNKDPEMHVASTEEKVSDAATNNTAKSTVYESASIEEKTDVDLDTLGATQAELSVPPPVLELPTVEKPKKHSINWLVFFTLLISSILLISCYQFVQYIIGLLNEGNLIALSIAGFSSIAAVIFLYLSIREIRAYLTFGKLDKQKQQYIALQGSSDRQQWLAFFEENQRLQKSEAAQCLHQYFFSLVKPHHDAEDLQNLYHAQVLEPLKVQAKKFIKGDIVASAAISGFSTNNFIQTLGLIYIHLRLVRKISSVFGFRANFFREVKLLTIVIKDVLLLAVTDVVAENLIAEVIGPGLLSKLGAQSAEALVSARLTYRISEALIRIMAFEKI